MSKKYGIGTSLSVQETISGFVWLAFQMLALPDILKWFNTRLGFGLNAAELNFTFYIINFLAVLLIFHDFLGRSLQQVTRHPIVFLEAVVLGGVAYYAMYYLTAWVIRLLVPSFANYNDASIAAMSQGNFFLMFLGTVILVPPVEEVLFRGVIFRNLYGKNKAVAYIVSIAAFGAIHILGYVGRYSPLELLMACLQYLPAGLCLAWSYTRGETVFAPIVIHALINFLSIRHLA